MAGTPGYLMRHTPHRPADASADVAHTRRLRTLNPMRVLLD